MLKSRKGSIYIEASMVMPLTCLIVVGMLLLAMGFYNQFIEQKKHHNEALKEWSMSESEYVWEIDKLQFFQA